MVFIHSVSLTTCPLGQVGATRSDLVVTIPEVINLQEIKNTINLDLDEQTAGIKFLAPVLTIMLYYVIYKFFFSFKYEKIPRVNVKKLIRFNSMIKATCFGLSLNRKISRRQPYIPEMVSQSRETPEQLTENVTQLIKPLYEALSINKVYLGILLSSTVSLCLAILLIFKNGLKTFNGYISLSIVIAQFTALISTIVQMFGDGKMQYDSNLAASTSFAYFNSRKYSEFKTDPSLITNLEDMCVWLEGRIREHQDKISDLRPIFTEWLQGHLYMSQPDQFDLWVLNNQDKLTPIVYASFKPVPLDKPIPEMESQSTQDVVKLAIDLLLMLILPIISMVCGAKISPNLFAQSIRDATTITSKLETLYELVCDHMGKSTKTNEFRKQVETHYSGLQFYMEKTNAVFFENPCLISQFETALNCTVKFLSQLPSDSKVTAMHLIGLVSAANQKLINIKQELSFKTLRQVPAALIFVGDPGIGKTTSARQILRDASKHFFPTVEPDRNIFSMTNASKYFPASVGQRFALFDEFIGKHDLSESTMLKHSREMISSAPFNMAGAEVSQKEQPCNFVGLIGCTNNSFEEIKNILQAGLGEKGVLPVFSRYRCYTVCLSDKYKDSYDVNNRNKFTPDTSNEFQHLQFIKFVWEPAKRLMVPCPSGRILTYQQVYKDFLNDVTQNKENYEAQISRIDSSVDLSVLSGPIMELQSSADHFVVNFSGANGHGKSFQIESILTDFEILFKLPVLRLTPQILKSREKYPKSIVIVDDLLKFGSNGSVLYENEYMDFYNTRLGRDSIILVGSNIIPTVGWRSYYPYVNWGAFVSHAKIDWLLHSIKIHKQYYLPFKNEGLARRLGYVGWFYNGSMRYEATDRNKMFIVRNRKFYLNDTKEIPCHEINNFIFSAYHKYKDIRSGLEIRYGQAELVGDENFLLVAQSIYDFQPPDDPMQIAKHVFETKEAFGNADLTWKAYFDPNLIISLINRVSEFVGDTGRPSLESIVQLSKKYYNLLLSAGIEPRIFVDLGPDGRMSMREGVLIVDCQPTDEIGFDYRDKRLRCMLNDDIFLLSLKEIYVADVNKELYPMKIPLTYSQRLIISNRIKQLHVTNPQFRQDYKRHVQEACKQEIIVQGQFYLTKFKEWLVTPMGKIIGILFASIILIYTSYKIIKWAVSMGDASDSDSEDEYTLWMRFKTENKKGKNKKGLRKKFKGGGIRKKHQQSDADIDDDFDDMDDVERYNYERLRGGKRKQRKNKRLGRDHDDSDDELDVTHTIDRVVRPVQLPRMQTAIEICSSCRRLYHAFGTKDCPFKDCDLYKSSNNTPIKDVSKNIVPESKDNPFLNYPKMLSQSIGNQDPVNNYSFFQKRCPSVGEKILSNIGIVYASHSSGLKEHSLQNATSINYGVIVKTLQTAYGQNNLVATVNHSVKSMMDSGYNLYYRSDELDVNGKATFWKLKRIQQFKTRDLCFLIIESPQAKGMPSIHKNLPKLQDLSDEWWTTACMMRFGNKNQLEILYGSATIYVPNETTGNNAFIVHLDGETQFRTYHANVTFGTMNGALTAAGDCGLPYIGINYDDELCGKMLGLHAMASANSSYTTAGFSVVTQEDVSSLEELVLNKNLNQSKLTECKYCENSNFLVLDNSKYSGREHEQIVWNPNHESRISNLLPELEFVHTQAKGSGFFFLKNIGEGGSVQHSHLKFNLVNSYQCPLSIINTSWQLFNKELLPEIFKKEKFPDGMILERLVRFDKLAKFISTLSFIKDGRICGWFDKEKNKYQFIICAYSFNCDDSKARLLMENMNAPIATVSQSQTSVTVKIPDGRLVEMPIEMHHVVNLSQHNLISEILETDIPFKEKCNVKIIGAFRSSQSPLPRNKYKPIPGSDLIKDIVPSLKTPTNFNAETAPPEQLVKLEFNRFGKRCARVTQELQWEHESYIPPPELIKRIYPELLKFTCMRYGNLTPLTDEEVFYGYPKGHRLFGYLGKLEVDKSIGWTMRAMFNVHHKSDAIAHKRNGQMEWKTTPAGTFAKDYYYYSKFLVAQGKHYFCTFNNYLKSEKLKNEKSHIGRIFCSADLNQILMERFVLGEFCARAMKEDDYCGVGCNPWQAFNNIAHNLRAKGNYFTGDYSRWDKTVPEWLFELVITLLQDANNGRPIRNMFRPVIQNICNSIHVSGNTMYFVKGGMPSGAFPTAPLNSFINLLGIYIATTDLVYQETRHWITFTEFEEHIYAKFYGDDVIVGVSNAISDIVNRQSMAQKLNELFGFNLGSSEKDGTLEKFDNFENLSWISRYFRPLMGKEKYFVGALKKPSINALLHWTSDLNPDQIAVQMMLAQIEASAWDSTYFAEIQQACELLCQYNPELNAKFYLMPQKLLCEDMFLGSFLGQFVAQGSFLSKYNTVGCCFYEQHQIQHIAEFISSLNISSKKGNKIPSHIMDLKYQLESSSLQDDRPVLTYLEFLNGLVTKKLIKPLQFQDFDVLIINNQHRWESTITCHYSIDGNNYTKIAGGVGCRKQVARENAAKMMVGLLPFGEPKFVSQGKTLSKSDEDPLTLPTNPFRTIVQPQDNVDWQMFTKMKLEEIVGEEDIATCRNTQTRQQFDVANGYRTFIKKGSLYYKQIQDLLIYKNLVPATISDVDKWIQKLLKKLLRLFKTQHHTNIFIKTFLAETGLDVLDLWKSLPQHLKSEEWYQFLDLQVSQSMDLGHQAMENGPIDAVMPASPAVVATSIEKATDNFGDLNPATSHLEMINYSENPVAIENWIRTHWHFVDNFTITTGSPVGTEVLRLSSNIGKLPPIIKDYIKLHTDYILEVEHKIMAPTNIAANCNLVASWHYNDTDNLDLTEAYRLGYKNIQLAQGNNEIVLTVRDKFNQGSFMRFVDQPTNAGPFPAIYVLIASPPTATTDGATIFSFVGTHWCRIKRLELGRPRAYPAPTAVALKENNALRLSDFLVSDFDLICTNNVVPVEYDGKNSPLANVDRLVPSDIVGLNDLNLFVHTYTANFNYSYVVDSKNVTVPSALFIKGRTQGSSLDFPKSFLCVVVRLGDTPDFGDCVDFLPEDKVFDIAEFDGAPFGQLLQQVVLPKRGTWTTYVDTGVVEFQSVLEGQLKPGSLGIYGTLEFQYGMYVFLSYSSIELMKVTTQGDYQTNFIARLEIDTAFLPPANPFGKTNIDHIAGGDVTFDFESFSTIPCQIPEWRLLDTRIVRPTSGLGGQILPRGKLVQFANPGSSLTAETQGVVVLNEPYGVSLIKDILDKRIAEAGCLGLTMVMGTNIGLTHTLTYYDGNFIVTDNQNFSVAAQNPYRTSLLLNINPIYNISAFSGALISPAPWIPQVKTINNHRSFPARRQRGDRPVQKYVPVMVSQAGLALGLAGGALGGLGQQMVHQGDLSWMSNQSSLDRELQRYLQERNIDAQLRMPGIQGEQNRLLAELNAKNNLYNQKSMAYLTNEQQKELLGLKGQSARVLQQEKSASIAQENALDRVHKSDLEATRQQHAKAMLDDKLNSAHVLTSENHYNALDLQKNNQVSRGVEMGAQHAHALDIQANQHAHEKEMLDAKLGTNKPVSFINNNNITPFGYNPVGAGMYAKMGGEPSHFSNLRAGADEFVPRVGSINMSGSHRLQTPNGAVASISAPTGSITMRNPRVRPQLPL